MPETHKRAQSFPGGAGCPGARTSVVLEFLLWAFVTGLLSIPAVALTVGFFMGLGQRWWGAVLGAGIAALGLWVLVFTIPLPRMSELLGELCGDLCR